MLPLVNIVFLLLIFFMLAGRLAATDPFEIAPPHSASEGAVGEHDIVVLIAADGRIALHGNIVDIDSLDDALADRLAEDTPTTMRLRADGAADATLVIAVMERLRATGVAQLELVTTPIADVR